MFDPLRLCALIPPMLGCLAAACSLPVVAAPESTEQSQQERADDAGAAPDDAGPSVSPVVADAGVHADAAVAPAAPASPPDFTAGTTWLSHVNAYRRMSKLAELSDDASLSNAAHLHAKYMLATGTVVHAEDPASPFFTRLGDESGRNSDVLATNAPGRFDTSIDNFVKAPFHLMLIMNPQLVTSGFGESSSTTGPFTYAAVLNVRQGVNAKLKVRDDAYPIRFPENDAMMPLVAGVTEYPDPLASCPTYSYPSGLPIVVQLAPKDDGTTIGAHTLKVGGKALDHCVLTAKTYVNAKDPVAQQLGRALLAAANAVVLIPKAPLTPKATYDVALTAGGKPLAWSFHVANNAR